MPVWFWLGSGAATLVALVGTAALVAILRGFGRELTELLEHGPPTLARPAQTKARPEVRV